MIEYDNIKKMTDAAHIWRNAKRFSGGALLFFVGTMVYQRIITKKLLITDVFGFDGRWRSERRQRRPDVEDFDGSERL